MHFRMFTTVRLVNAFVASHNYHLVVFVAQLDFQAKGKSHHEGEFHTDILQADWALATRGQG